MHEITNSGWVEVIAGSMFSGKTEELLRRLRRAEIAGQDAAAFTPAVDERYGEAKLGSHAGRTWQAKVIDPTPNGVWEIPEALDGQKVVAIDEANFFPAELVDVVDQLAADGRRVLVSGTDVTFRGEPVETLAEGFVEANRLVELVEEHTPAEAA